MAIDTSSSISGIMTTAQYNAQKAATPQKTEMGQTEFLTLFTTQLKNQNPLEPVKNEAFVAQLAQGSAEQVCSLLLIEAPDKHQGSRTKLGGMVLRICERVADLTQRDQAKARRQRKVIPDERFRADFRGHQVSDWYFQFGIIIT